MRLPSIPNVWIRAIGITIASILILIFYPENWRQDIAGGLFTALFGGVFLVVLVWALGIASSPYPKTVFEDAIDDLAAVYHWLQVHSGPFRFFYTFLEKIFGWPFIHQVLYWLNPRRHTWNLVILVAILAGIGLACIELLSEGSDPQQIGRFALVAAVFVGLEGTGVLLSYALLAKPMGLFRHAFDAKESR